MDFHNQSAKVIKVILLTEKQTKVLQKSSILWFLTALMFVI